jgi:hypothetical protein
VGGAFAVTQVFAGAFGAASATPLLNATEVVHLLHESCSASTAPAAAPTAQVVAQTVPSAAPPPTPTPFATPGIPRVITGPGTLVPPTAPPSGPVVTPPPLPTPTPTPVASNGPVLLVRPTPGPTGSGAPGPSPANIPTAGPVPLPTLGPNQFAVLGDELSGSTKEGLPADYKGNVHIFYSEGTIVGDLAHYDGDHTVTVTGHAYIINHNADSILYADKIVFDSKTGNATLTNGRGETKEGVEKGELHFSGQTLVVDRNGKTHGSRGSFTTCENQRGGYHVESKSIDVQPGDKLIAHSATVFLGALAVFFLPVLIIPLKTPSPGQRATSFIPQVGYDEADGVYVIARVGFGKDDYYYGYYRIEEYTKRGLGLGYVGYIGRRDGRRQLSIDVYTFNGYNGTGRQYNANIVDQENFSQRTRGQLNFQYIGDYGPYVSLPPSYNLTGSIVHAGNNANQNYTFSRSLTGSQSASDNLGFIDQLQLSKTLSEGFNISYTDYSSNYPGQINSSSETLHLQSITHLFSKAADYTLTYDRSDSNQPFGYNTEPALEIVPHLPFENSRIPVQVQVTWGFYSEAQNYGMTPMSTERIDMVLNVGPALFKVFRTSDFSVGFTVDQDLYGTGDEKASVTQTLGLTTPIGKHIINAITYDEQNPIGPPDVPFELLDRLSTGSHQAQDVLRFFNGDIYSLSLSAGTNFDREAQPVLYQLTTRPSPRSALILSGSWQPGGGQGFDTTNVQLFTPFGRESDLALTTNVNWKDMGSFTDKLQDKTIFYRRVIGECYDVLASYNEDLKQFNLNFELLAFPGQSAGVGIAGNQPLAPTGFNY